MKVLTLDIGGTEIKTGLVENNLLTEKERYSSLESVKNGSLSKLILSVIANNISDDLDGISISTAGDVDPFKGEIVFATDNFVNYKGTKLKQIVEKTFNIRCEVINDVHSALYYELQNFENTDKKRVALITLGTGVGGAMAINGNVVFGDNFDAYRLGHLCYEKNGKLCGCGKKGCIEQYVSASQLTLLSKESGYNNDLRNLFIDYHNNEKLPTYIVKEYFERLEKSVLIIKNYTNFDLLIIGGGITGSKDLWLNDFTSRKSIKNLDIETAKSGNNAGMLGAYKWFLERKIK